jgi:hypothetical protein
MTLLAKLKTLCGRPEVLEQLARTRARYARTCPRPAGRPYLVAKVKDGIALPTDRTERDALLAQYGWRELEARFERRLLHTGLFGSKALAGLREQTKIAQGRNPDFRAAKFEQYLRVDPVPALPLAKLEELAKALQAGRPGELFERGAYVNRPGPPPQVNWPDDPGSGGQLYLEGGGVGVNAKTAWAFAGADGAPTKGAAPKFRNIDCGWRLQPPAAPGGPLGPIDHEDLDAVPLNPPPVGNYGAMSSHGTEMLGIVLARDNQVGGVGIVPHLPEVGLVYYDPYYDPENPPNPPDPNGLPGAVGTAMAGLQVGDVILIEAQVYAPGSDKLAPPEIYRAEWDAIRTATAAGIVVIEPCGNGTADGPPVLDVDSELTHGESEAILVTAAASWPHARLPYTAFGKRVDCYAWGDTVLTCADYGSRSDYGLTGGTSAASAIIAGVALAVQCAYIEKTNGTARLDGPTMRQKLRNSAYGTPPAPGAEPIGSMPDLHTVISNL